MAKKISLQGNAIEIEDTVTGFIDLSLKAVDCWYDEKKLEENSQVQIYYISNGQQRGSSVFELSETVDRSETTFTKASFRDFARDSMGSASDSQATEYTYAVALNKVTGSTTWNKFAYNLDIDSGTEVVASFGGSFFPMTTADTLEIVSTSESDDSEGTGVNSVVLYGVDENREYQVEVVTMDGTTDVRTSNQWLGINRIAPFLTGSGFVNAGSITARTTTGETIIAEMPAGGTVTQQAIFYVQAGHTFLADYLFINALKLAGGSAPRVTIKGWVFSPIANSKIQVFETDIDTAVSNVVEIKPSQPFPITEKSVLWFEATTNTNDTAVSMRFSGIEVKN